MRKQYVPALLAALALLIPSVAFADATASNIVSQFNSMNSNNGYLFTATTGSGFYSTTYGSGESRLINQGTDMPNLGAYGANTSSATYFHSFCVEPTRQLDAAEVNSGKLNYANNRTTAVMNELGFSSTLSLGAAYLYKEFAKETLSDYTFTQGNARANDSAILQDAIWYLVGHSDLLKVTTNTATIWTDNKYLKLLNNMAGYSQADWMATYDPGQSYSSLMEDYRVFIMRTVYQGLGRTPVQYRQDVLYVAKGGGNDVPEPATMLLWTLGSVGAAGVAYRKRRNKAIK